MSEVVTLRAISAVTGQGSGRGEASGQGDADF